ncbi:MAG: 16S rRNA (cytosine(1402)-N(4))-methyltransferase RsmH [Christensenellales bacterium]|jgi:16S rRNA (cytosine1402-N4)-methyltransferase
MEFSHKPVMPKEVLYHLAPERGGVFADGTLGGGGHAELVLSALPQSGRLVGIDRDDDALAAASKRLERFGERFTAVKGNFFDIRRILQELKIESLDGMLVDLGVSSYQLDNPERGFSYHVDAPLDMRMDQSAALSAYDVVNGYDHGELTRILREYGEEKWASRIASFIIEARKKQPLRTTHQLVEIIKAAIPNAARREGGHPAKRTFQAIRVEVNGELAGLKQAVEDMVDCLAPQGRLVVLTFQSLEDRIVKKAFAELKDPCTCPKSAPLCVCGKMPKVRILTRKPLTAKEEELNDNPRAKSAKLRAVEKL